MKASPANPLGYYILKLGIMHTAQKDVQLRMGKQK